MLDFDRKYVVLSNMQAVLNAMCACGTFRLNELLDGSETEMLISFAGLQSIGFLRAAC